MAVWSRLLLKGRDAAAVGSELDLTYWTIMQELVATGAAPHCVELAPQLGISPDETLRRIERIMELTPGWLHPGRDYIASFHLSISSQPHTESQLMVDNVGLPNVVSKHWHAAGFPETGCTH